MLAFGLIALVSSAAIELATSVQLHSFFTTNTIKNDSMLLQQFNSNIETDVDSVRKTLIYLAFNTYVQDYFAQGETQPSREQLDRIYRVEEMLSTMLSYNNLVSAVCLFPTEWMDRVYVDKSAYFTLPEYPYRLPWYEAFAVGKSVSTSYISTYRGSNTRYNLARKVLDQAGERWIGTVLVSYDIKNLRAFVNTFDLGKQGVIAVYNQEQEVYLTPNADETPYGKALRAYRPAREGSFVERIAGRETLINALQSKVTGWLILSAVPMDYINRTLRQVILISYGIFASTLMVTVLVSLRLAGNISRPIASLKAHMQRVMVGDFSAHMPTLRTDEIGDIIHTFNQMTEKINALVKTVCETELRQKDSENRALLAQINPHFLYNTLESIRMLAVLNDDDDVSVAIRYLGKYLRYAMNWSKRFMTLGEELAHLKNYLAIYQLKNSAFLFEQQIPETLYPYLVIKMCLQPLVENSIQHGFQNRPGGLLRISARLDGNRLAIVVSDNGVGMPPDEMRRVQEALNLGIADTSANIGLLNIQHRIKLLFGSAYGLRLQPSSLGGMDVVLTVAAICEEKEDADVQIADRGR